MKKKQKREPSLKELSRRANQRDISNGITYLESGDGRVLKATKAKDGYILTSKKK